MTFDYNSKAINSIWKFFIENGLKPFEMANISLIKGAFFALITLNRIKLDRFRTVNGIQIGVNLHLTSALTNAWTNGY